jgi:hypothetical protein
MIYNEYEALTAEGRELDKELFQALIPIVNKYAANNSTREVFAAIVNVAGCIVAEASLKKAVAKRKQANHKQAQEEL